MKTSMGIAAITALCGSALAGTSYDANVTSNVIFGSGNANGGFTVNQQNGIEVGLRAKVRFDSNNQPQNQFNSNGDGTYTFGAGLPPTGFGWAPGSTSTATWNFEWSVNADVDNTSGNVLSSYEYKMFIDFNPAAGNDTSEGSPDVLFFDPINVPWADHAFGDSTTANGDGVKAAGSQSNPDFASYASLVGSNSMAQNSWNMEFFDHLHPNGFDGRVVGEYEIRLEVYDDEGGLLGGTSIFINVVPMPAASAMAGVGLLAVGARRRR